MCLLEGAVEGLKKKEMEVQVLVLLFQARVSSAL